MVISEILRVTSHLNSKESWSFLCLLTVGLCLTLPSTHKSPSYFTYCSNTSHHRPRLLPVNNILSTKVESTNQYSHRTHTNFSIPTSHVFLRKLSAEQGHLRPEAVNQFQYVVQVHFRSRDSISLTFNSDLFSQPLRTIRPLLTRLWRQGNRCCPQALRPHQ